SRDRREHATRPPLGAVGGGAPAARLHEMQAGAHAELPELPGEVLEVTPGLGADVGVQAGRREPLVLAVERDDLVAERELHARRLLRDDLRRALLVRRVEEREQEAD